MAELVYILCAVMSIACTVALFRGYRRSRSSLLLWSALCFLGLTLNNAVLFVDMVLLPDIDIGGAFLRSCLSAASGSLLLFGLIWELT